MLTHSFKLLLHCDVYWAAELWEHFHQDYYSSLRSKHSLPEDIGKQRGGDTLTGDSHLKKYPVVRKTAVVMDII